MTSTVDAFSECTLQLSDCRPGCLEARDKLVIRERGLINHINVRHEGRVLLLEIHYRGGGPRTSAWRHPAKPFLALDPSTPSI